jgi:DNA-directed RNA polymerase subunit N (RpoN/RPB10)
MKNLFRKTPKTGQHAISDLKETNEPQINPLTPHELGVLGKIFEKFAFINFGKSHILKALEKDYSIESARAEEIYSLIIPFYVKQRIKGRDNPLYLTQNGFSLIRKNLTQDQEKDTKEIFKLIWKHLLVGGSYPSQIIESLYTSITEAGRKLNIVFDDNGVELFCIRLYSLGYVDLFQQLNGMRDLMNHYIKLSKVGDKFLQHNLKGEELEQWGFNTALPYRKEQAEAFRKIIAKGLAEKNKNLKKYS